MFFVFCLVGQRKSRWVSGRFWGRERPFLLESRETMTVTRCFAVLSHPCAVYDVLPSSINKVQEVAVYLSYFSISVCKLDPNGCSTFKMGSYPEPYWQREKLNKFGGPKP